MSQRNKPNRNRALAAAGGALALGGLGYLLYQQWASSSSSTSASSSKKADSNTKRRGPPPTLSLSLPPTFVRSKQELALVAALLTILAEHYTITLIVPSYDVARSCHRRKRSRSEAGAVLEKDDESDGQGKNNVREGISHLRKEYGGIDGFDCRRMLEYSKEEGRLTMIRALGCDAHCEVMLESMAISRDKAYASPTLGEEQLFDDDAEAGAEDGDATPRATSPARPTPMHPPPLRRHHSREDVEGERRATMLERYHAEMARIRKSSSLLIFLLLPVREEEAGENARSPSPAGSAPATPTKNNVGPQDSRMAIASLDIETVLRPFLMPGQRDLSSRVPGVKVIDCRLFAKSASAAREGHVSPRSTTTEHEGSEIQVLQAWQEGAMRLSRLSLGWS